MVSHDSWQSCFQCDIVAAHGEMKNHFLDPRPCAATDRGHRAVGGASDRRCSGALLGLARKSWFATSAVVSDMAEKVGGDIVQPMVQAVGMATRGSSSGYRGGIIASFGQSLAWNDNLQSIPHCNN